MKNKKEKGFAIMLFSLILLIGFHIAEWQYVFDFNLKWAHVWMVLGTIGFFMVIFDGKKKKSDDK